MNANHVIDPIRSARKPPEAQTSRDYSAALLSCTVLKRSVAQNTVKPPLATENFHVRSCHLRMKMVTMTSCSRTYIVVVIVAIVIAVVLMLLSCLVSSCR